MQDGMLQKVRMKQMPATNYVLNIVLKVGRWAQGYSPVPSAQFIEGENCQGEF